MPIPSPSKSEKKSDFISRCMGDNVMNNEFPNQGQRYKICLTKWEDKKNKSSASLNLDGDEIIYFTEEI